MQNKFENQDCMEGMKNWKLKRIWKGYFKNSNDTVLYYESQRCITIKDTNCCVGTTPYFQCVRLSNDEIIHTGIRR